MFSSSKPVFLDSRSRRARKRVPRWLVLLVGGVALGVAGVLYIQERHLPPRLTAAASQALQKNYDQADAERKQLAASLDTATKRVQTLEAEKARLESELSGSKQSNDALRKDVASALAALPADPRGGTVEVRAGTFSARAGSLTYDVALSRNKVSGQALTGVMQLVVEGSGLPSASNVVTLGPVEVSLSNFASLNGTLPLPEGFVARQVTVKVLDRVGGKLLGMRVLRVK